MESKGNRSPSRKPLPLLDATLNSLNELERQVNGKFHSINKTILFDIKKAKENNGLEKKPQSDKQVSLPKNKNSEESNNSDESFLLERTIIKGIDISTLEEDSAEEEKKRLENFKKFGSNAITLDKIGLEKDISYKAYSTIPSEINLSSSLQYQRKEQERRKVHLMFERSSVIHVKKKRKKKHNKTLNSPNKKLELNYDDLNNIEKQKKNKKRKSKTYWSVGDLNRITNDTELLSRPLAGLHQIDWNRLHLGNKTKNLQSDSLNGISLSSRNVSFSTLNFQSQIPRSSSMGNLNSNNQDFVSSPNSSTHLSSNTLSPKTNLLQTTTEITQPSSRTRKNYIKERSLFEKLSNLNSSIYDDLNIDIESRTKSLENDLQNIISARARKSPNRNLISLSKEEIQIRSKYSHYFRFIVQLLHENDIKLFYYHIKFIDTLTENSYEIYNCKLNVKNYIQWEKKEFVFCPFDKFNWITEPKDIEGKSFEILIKASIKQIEPKEKYEILDEENDIFSKSFRGGVVDMVNSSISFNQKIFLNPINSKGQLISFQCKNASNSSTKKKKLIDPNILKRSELDKKTLNNLSFSLTSTIFNDSLSISNKRPDKRVPHSPRSKADSFRPDLSTIDPFESLRKHPLFKTWKPSNSVTNEYQQQSINSNFSPPKYDISLHSNLSKLSTIDAISESKGKPPRPNI